MKRVTDFIPERVDLDHWIPLYYFTQDDGTKLFYRGRGPDVVEEKDMETWRYNLSNFQGLVRTRD